MFSKTSQTHWPPNVYVPDFSKAQGSLDFLPSAELDCPLSLQLCQFAPGKKESNKQNSDSQVRRLTASKENASYLVAND